MAKTFALIVAAGRGRRFGEGLPKQYHRLAGRPVLAWTLEAFAKHPAVDAVRAVIHPDDEALYAEAAAGLDLLPPVPGGGERQDSVRLGLESLAALAGAADARVLIHDGARPHPGDGLLTRVIEALETVPGALPCLPVTDTMKRAIEGFIIETLPRDELFRAQTPQGFHLRAILSAHRRAQGQALTDDAAVAEAAGLAVSLVAGNPDNLKITTAEDLETAARLLEVPLETRSGNGFDVHRLIPGSGLWLCGHFIEHDQSLEGHSDADVGIHALVDALLGAQSAGDIGQHFPPSDPQWKGATSDRFLAHACRLLAEAGGQIVNMDVTLICEAPKVGPHRQAMRRTLAQIAEVPLARVSVKATTSEKLGFTGRGEGIAAMASVSIRMPAPSDGLTERSS